MQVVAAILRRPQLMVPQIQVSDLRWLRFRQLHGTSPDGVLVDKDNTLVPHKKDIGVYSTIAAAVDEAVELWGRERFLVVSNSTGCTDSVNSYPVDRPVSQAGPESWPSSLTAARSVPVLQHNLRKPFCRDEIQSYFAKLNPNQPEEADRQNLKLSTIGDRLLTDVVLGNINGWVSIHTSPLDPSRDQLSVKISRWLENQVYRWKFSGRNLFTQLQCEEFGTAKFLTDRRDQLHNLLSGCGTCSHCLLRNSYNPRPNLDTTLNPLRRPFSSISLPPFNGFGAPTLHPQVSNSRGRRNFATGSGGYTFSSFDNREGVQVSEQSLFQTPPTRKDRSRQRKPRQGADNQGRPHQPRAKERTHRRGTAHPRGSPSSHRSNRDRSRFPPRDSRGRRKVRPLTPLPLTPGEVVSRCRLVKVEAFTAFGVVFRLVLDTDGQVLGEKIEVSHDDLDNMPMYLGDIIPLWETREAKTVRTNDRSLQSEHRQVITYSMQPRNQRHDFHRWTLLRALGRQISLPLRIDSEDSVWMTGLKRRKYAEVSKQLKALGLVEVDEKSETIQLSPHGKMTLRALSGANLAMHNSTADVSPEHSEAAMHMMLNTVKAAKKLLDSRIETVDAAIRAADRYIASSALEKQDLLEERENLRTPSPTWKRWDDERLNRIRQIEADVERLERLMKEAEDRKVTLSEERQRVIEKQTRVQQEVASIVAQHQSESS